MCQDASEHLLAAQPRVAAEAVALVRREVRHADAADVVLGGGAAVEA